MEIKDIELLLHKTYKKIGDTDKLEEFGLGLFSGIAGVIIYCFNYGDYFHNLNAKGFAYELLRKRLKEEEISSHTYCNGASGLCSMLSYLSEENFINKKNANEIMNLFDGYISNKMLIDAELGNNDLLHGSLGSALYLLRRNNGL